MNATMMMPLEAGAYSHLETSQCDGPGLCVRNKLTRAIWWFGGKASCESYLRRLRAGLVEIQVSASY